MKLNNGATVIKTMHGKNGQAYVAACWYGLGNEQTQWVTWAVDKGATYWGHYFDTEAQALYDLNKRANAL